MKVILFIVNTESVLEEFVKEKGTGFAVDGSKVKEIKELINNINKNR